MNPGEASALHVEYVAAVLDRPEDFRAGEVAAALRFRAAMTALAVEAKKLGVLTDG